MIAEGVLGGDPRTVPLGSVRLHSHQLTALTRVLRALDDVGGVLLADAVGLGKTYVALAASREFERVLVIAPAVLRSTWMESSALADVRIRFVSTESLSRAAHAGPSADLVIVDEAHHFRNPCTRRYARLAEHTARARVLLLTATPIHNRREDLSALLALFLGARACALTPELLARCVIRREHEDVALSLPRLARVRRIMIPADRSFAREILALPPPMPPRDGGEAGTLVRLGLLHVWTSSDAALERGVRRRLAAGMAMREALADGRIPARRELRSWLGADDALQLGFTSLLVDDVAPSGSRELAALDLHVAALRRLLSLIRSARNRDAIRASQLRQLLLRHAGERILAFASYSSTVHALYRALAPEGGVAAVTARGGWIASGRIVRDEVLRMFRAPRHAREEVRLLIATDLLSEGLNLQEASVVVHLDLPWTVARLEQRVGRARRPHSVASLVRSYVFVQPRAVERMIGRERLLASKECSAAQSIATPSYGACSPYPASPPCAAEHTRRLLGTWRSGAAEPTDGLIRVGAIAAGTPGFLALIRTRRGNVLLAAHDSAGQQRGDAHDSPRADTAAPQAPSSLTATTDPLAIHDTVARAVGGDARVFPQSYARARRAIERWIANDSARRTAATVSASAHEVKLILRRIESAVSRAPLHRRPSLAQRVSRVRASLSARLSRGTELAVAARARAIADDEELVDELETLLQGLREARAASDVEVIAVLLLETRAQRTESAKRTSAARWPYPAGWSMPGSQRCS